MRACKKQSVCNVPVVGQGHLNVNATLLGFVKDKLDAVDTSLVALLFPVYPLLRERYDVSKQKKKKVRDRRGPCRSRSR